MPTQSFYVPDDLLEALKLRAGELQTTPARLAMQLTRAALAAGLEPARADARAHPRARRLEAALLGALEGKAGTAETLATAVGASEPGVVGALAALQAEGKVRSVTTDGFTFWALAAEGSR
jgi:hypothetical protein